MDRWKHENYTCIHLWVTTWCFNTGTYKMFESGQTHLLPQTFIISLWCKLLVLFSSFLKYIICYHYQSPHNYVEGCQNLLLYKNTTLKFLTWNFNVYIWILSFLSLMLPMLSKTLMTWFIKINQPLGIFKFSYFFLFLVSFLSVLIFVASSLFTNFGVS